METELIFRSSERKKDYQKLMHQNAAQNQLFSAQKDGVADWPPKWKTGTSFILPCTKKKLLKIQCVVMWRSYFPPFSHHCLGEKHHLGEKNKSVFFDSVLLCSHISRECNSSGLAAHVCCTWYMQLQFHYPGFLFLVCAS